MPCANWVKGWKVTPGTPAPTNITELEQAANKIIQVINSAYTEACPEKILRQNRHHWWNRALASARKRVRVLHKKALQENSELSWREYLSKKKEYKKELRKTKRKAWREYCLKTENIKESARIFKLLEKDYINPLGLLQDENGVYCTTSEETLNLMARAHFPSSGSSDTQTMNNTPMPNWRKAYEVISWDAYKWAVWSYSLTLGGE
ncbi:uncharacterized protein LOC112126374 [Cimex lectularius]|uniref:Uncharacterized protein n=1 Tax=Cimex lectularius TaxID=79782 RepID=A0A8I6SFF7_CIMLE|nr:uncharacterized protein LOC112126374 [Cimex lectularius]